MSSAKCAPQISAHADATTGWNVEPLTEILNNDAGKPVLFTNATVHTLDPVIGSMSGADVLLGGDLVVGVGPGIITAAGDDGAIVVDCAGMTIVPAAVDLRALHGHRVDGTTQLATLRPGNRADLAVLYDPCAAAAADASRSARQVPDVCALLSAGRVLRWDGRDLEPVASAAADVLPAHDLAGEERLGIWIDTSDFLHQELTADGRYDETRGGRPHAFQGRFWIDGDRIDYLDDLGFWAFGEFREDELHHAGYAMRRR